jgi:hypothetical protein
MKHLALLLAGAAALAATAVPAHADEDNWGRNHIRHVLLISIDGMHALDYRNCAQGVSGVNDGAAYCPHLAALGAYGVNYVAASTSRPSDSFPGLMSIVSGATPRTMGVYYDVAYDRSLDAPAKATGNGVAAGPCSPGGTPTGTRTEYEEGIDLDQSKLNGGGSAIPAPAARRYTPGTSCAPIPSSAWCIAQAATPRGQTNILPTPQ